MMIYNPLKNINSHRFLTTIKTNTPSFVKFLTTQSLLY